MASLERVILMMISMMVFTMVIGLLVMVVFPVSQMLMISASLMLVMVRLLVVTSI